MGIKGQKWTEKLSKAEEYFKENPNANWDDILRTMEFVEETDYDKELYKLTLGEESTNVTVMDYCNGNYSYVIAFSDLSCIEIFENNESYDRYLRVDAVWSDITDLSTRKEVHYISRNDIIVYTD